MAGQLAVTARKSIPVENRSGRVFMMAGVSAAVIATSQWAHWMGYADWDLLSIIPGFAQVSGLLPNAYADGRNFDCPNKTLGAEIALMSDDMLKTVGKTLCTKEELIAASLRGSDGRPRLHPAAFVTPSPEALVLPLMPLMSAQPRLTASLPLAPPAQQAPVVKSFTMASIEPAKRNPDRELIDAINRRAHQVEDVDPCAAGKILAGCEFVDPGTGGGSSGGGSSGGGGSGGGTGTDNEDHTGSGGEGSSGSGGDDNEWTDGNNSGDGSHSGSGSDGGEGGEGSHDGSTDYADGGEGHGGGDSHGGDLAGGEGSHDGGESGGGSGEGSHDGSDSHDGVDSHDGGETHEVADNTEHEGSRGGDYTHDDSSDHLDSPDSGEHSGSSGGDSREDSGDHEDGDSSHSDGGEGGGSGSGGGGHSGGRG